MKIKFKRDKPSPEYNTFEQYSLDDHNENPECGNTDYADFTTKPYFNILLDDKAGMEMNSDWSLVKSELQRIGEW